MESKTVVRQDGWANFLTGVGGRQDKSTGTYFSASSRRLGRNEMANMYVHDSLSRSIVEKPADAMTRSWIDLEETEEDDKKLIETKKYFAEEHERLNIQGAFNQALKYQRLDGGSALLMHSDDSGALETPMPENATITKLKLIRVRDISLDKSVWNEDAENVNFGEVEQYMVNFTVNKKEIPTLVHASRFLTFKGALPPKESKVEPYMRYWGTPVLYYMYDDLKKWSGMTAAISSVVQEFVIGKYKIHNLEQLLQNKEYSHLYDRMEIINACKSTIRAVLLGAEEEYTRDTASMGGIDSIIDRWMMMISGGCRVPVSTLWGRSAAGLNATGEGDDNNWDDEVDAGRKELIKPALTQLHGYIGRANNMEPLPVTFLPLSQPSDAEIAGTEKTRADTALVKAQEYVAYITNQVLTPEQVFDREWKPMGLTWEEPVQVNRNPFAGMFGQEKENRMDEAAQPVLISTRSPDNTWGYLMWNVSEAVQKDIVSTSMILDPNIRSKKWAYGTWMDKVSTKYDVLMETHPERGMLGFLLYKEDPQDPTYIHIADLYIVEEARRRGIGERLLKRAMKGYNKVEMPTHIGIAMKSLLKKAGFTVKREPIAIELDDEGYPIERDGYFWKKGA